MKENVKYEKYGEGVVETLTIDLEDHAGEKIVGARREIRNIYSDVEAAKKHVEALQIDLANAKKYIGEERKAAKVLPKIDRRLREKFYAHFVHEQKFSQLSRNVDLVELIENRLSLMKKSFPSAFD